MKKLFCVLAYLLLAVPCRAEIIIVDDDWPYDFNNIQAAINYSSDGDFIFVFPGRYTGTGNRDIDFLGKAVTVRSIVPTDPYIVAETIIDCNGVGRGLNFTNGEDANSILAGFTITNGYTRGAIRCSNSSPTITNCIISDNNSGIYCSNGSSPTITNCTITANSVVSDGGGISCFQSSPTITNCTFSKNTSDRAGGIYCYSSSPIITNCAITANSAVSDGGGIYCYYPQSNPTIVNCTITDNSAGRDGGGICGFADTSTITNCIITGNSAGRDGSGIYRYAFSRGSKVVHCTVTGNSASRNGGGIFSGDIYFSPPISPCPITNCIVWDNSDSNGQGQSAQIYGEESDVWFSCIRDDNPDDANIPFSEEKFNIDDDPCFVSPGFWVDANDPNIIVEPNDHNAVWLDGDYHLLPASPCIEKGDPYFTYHAGDIDMDAQLRLMGRRVDIGADEFEIAVVVVIKPQGGEVWVAGSMHEIKWHSYSITGTVDISYSDNNGTDWIIIGNVPDTGSFTWHLPAEVDSNRCLIAVEPNVYVPNLTCIKSDAFTIHPDSPGTQVSSKWKSLGGDFNRAGLSQNSGPQLGCVKWQFQTNGPVSASPSIGDGNWVHLSCEDGNLYTLDANGLFLWSYDTNSPLLSSPTIGPDGSVFVGAENGKLYAIDVNGNLRWTHSTDGFIYSSPAVSADSNVYVCSQDGRLYALGQDGSELWSFETDTRSSCASGSIFASPAIGLDGTIYIAGFYDPNLYALVPNDGSVKWSRSFLDPCDPHGKSPRPLASPVIAADGTIYISPLFDTNLYAIDSNNGSILWSTNLSDPCSGWFGPDYDHSYSYNWSEPALGPDGTIYVSFDDSYLRAVDPNGSIRWVTRLGVMGGFTLIIGSDGLIYATGDDGCLCVIDPNGEEIARFKGDNWLSFPVITSDNTMIVSDANNTVWSIGGSGCEGQAPALHRSQDLSMDWVVNFEDFALLANDWLRPGCFALDAGLPCDEPDDGIYFTGDIDRDLYVDFADILELANRWLNQD